MVPNDVPQQLKNCNLQSQEFYCPVDGYAFLNNRVPCGMPFAGSHEVLGESPCEEDGNFYLLKFILFVHVQK